jgi:RimJ/RimL family protein N-acetyltransferase
MFARTKRLTLRPGWPEDAALLAEAIAHEAVATRLARVPWPYTLDDAAAFLAVPRGAADARFLIMAHDGAAPRLVGGIGLDAAADGIALLGYWLTPDAWGRGYATEAGRAVLDMARHALPLRRLEARHHLDNPASGRVLRKLGFREIRREPSFSLARGHHVDSAVLALDLAAGKDAGEDADAATDRMPIAA